MNFTKAFTYIFDDKRWLEKLLIPLLVTLIPIIGWMVVSGYVMRVIRNVAQHEIEPLPTLEFGNDLGRGFKMFVADFVYALPALVIYLVFLLPVFLSNNNNTITIIAIISSIIGWLLFVAYILILVFLLPVVNANLAVKGNLGAAFDFKTIFGMIKNNLKAWLIVLGGSLLCSAIIAPLGAIVVFIGAIITGLYSQLVVAHLSGQAYIQSQTPGGEGTPRY